ncbi:MAG: WYL domain-containing protein [Actinomycetia bacterium]|nr:WYL domain-containing protein [Actinomycetes bacterium]
MREASPLDELGDAARTHEAITFAYESGEKRSDRHAEPYRIVLHKRCWYVLGWDLDRDDWRTYRVDRMAGLGRAGGFVPREIPGGASAVHQDDATPPHCALLTFAAPLSTVTDRLLTHEAEFETVDAARCRGWLWVDSYVWLAAVVLSMGIDFLIEEPDGFREHCQGLRDRLDRAVRR